MYDKYKNPDHDAWLLQQAEENCHDSDEEERDTEYDEECRAEYEADAYGAWCDKWY